MSHIEHFTNDSFKALAYLYDVKNRQNKAHVTQQEIADELNLSRVTINRIIGELKVAGYIEQDGSHVGRYIITPYAIKVVESFRNIKNPN
jgi:DNA-binding IclR family transcriptional regulator